MATKTENLITVREAARACGRNPETVRRWIWDGKLPARKLGNQLFVRRADILRLTPSKKGDRQERLAVLQEIKAIRERIHRRVGVIDVLEALDRSREAHP
ncbi:MAG: helix-turn-helix domain-containing protein [Chloroflexota bacterium]